MNLLSKENKTILITEGAGFIGSNFIPYFLDVNLNIDLINLDKLTYAGSLDNLKEVEFHSRYKFILGDICDKGLITQLFNDYSIPGMIHFAAESHVDNSIKSPIDFIRAKLRVLLIYWKSPENLVKSQRIGSIIYQQMRFMDSYVKKVFLKKILNMRLIVIIVLQRHLLTSW